LEASSSLEIVGGTDTTKLVAAATRGGGGGGGGGFCRCRIRCEPLLAVVVVVGFLKGPPKLRRGGGGGGIGTMLVAALFKRLKALIGDLVGDLVVALLFRDDGGNGTCLLSGMPLLLLLGGC